jgi:DHA2 family multidrug resistance protein
VATLAAQDAGSGSAIFNIFRNVGGSFGIAILSTLITRREQFHDLRIGELVTVYSPATQTRLAAVQGNFVNKGFDATVALKQSYAVIKSLVSREAFVMAFNDAFLVITIALLVCAVAIWFCKKPGTEQTHAPAG